MSLDTTLACGMLYLGFVKSEAFTSDRFGRANVDPDSGLCWFDPAPLPDRLPLDEETQLALSKADGALGRLDGLARLLQNPDLVASPYVAREAVASSRIEGTRATLTDVYEAEAGRARLHLDDVDQVENYRNALNLGLAAVLKPDGLTLDVLRDVHAELMEGQRLPTGWRTDHVWLGSTTGGPETAVFVPPPSGYVEPLMRDWAEWHRNPRRMPLLIRVALLHYQFLTIHPFLDGNGRVGRLLIQLVLEEERALAAPLLYVSAYFAKNRQQYYDRLQAVRERGEIQQWLQYFLTAVYVQAEDGVERARHLLNLREEYRSALSGSRSRASEVVDLLFVVPVVTARRVQSELGMTNQGAINLLRSLEERGWVRQMAVGQRGTKFWYAPEILGLFDDEREEPALEGPRHG